MEDTVLDYGEAAALVSPNAPIWFASILALIILFLVLLIWQIRAFAVLSDLLSAKEPFSDGWRPIANLRAIRRCFPDVVSVLSLWRPIKVGWAFLRTCLREDNNTSFHWYVEQVLDPNSRMGLLEKRRRKQAFVHKIMVPLVVFLFGALTIAIYVLHENLMDGWWSASWTAAWYLLVGFFANWVHRWASPLFVALQTVKVTYLWGHAC